MRTTEEINAAGLAKITPELVASGDVYVEVYPMKTIPSEEDDGSTDSRLVECDEEPDFYDVWVRPDDWDLNDGSTYAEFDDLSEAEMNAKVTELEQMFPGIAVNEVQP